MNRTLSLFAAAAALGMAVPAAGWAQQQGDPDDEWCDRRGRGRDRDERYCEVREFTLDARDLVTVDAGPNGGIEVEGWDRNEILVRARVQTWSEDDDPADIVLEIEIITGSEIRAEGPRFRGRSGNRWSVSFAIMVPRESDLSLESVNGGIGISAVTGDMDFRTTNGGISLVGVSGDVRGSTTNGGLHVELDGEEWVGRGLDVRTINGGVNLEIPENFRADLEIGTRNGGFEIDFPIVLQGRINRRQIRTELNGGGTLIRAVTTNGGVRVRRR
ncbi:MAG: hypothetical protein O7I93_17755 [Gemmatimonadetes bacterium]|nr:hypothetical protein [Gemmatimonadota bacterium]